MPAASPSTKSITPPRPDRSRCSACCRRCFFALLVPRSRSPCRNLPCLGPSRGLPPGAACRGAGRAGVTRAGGGAAPTAGAKPAASGAPLPTAPPLALRSLPRGRGRPPEPESPSPTPGSWSLDSISTALLRDMLNKRGKVDEPRGSSVPAAAAAAAAAVLLRPAPVAKLPRPCLPTGHALPCPRSCHS